MDPMAFTTMDITASDMDSLIKKAKKKAKQARARVKKLQQDNPETNAKIQIAWKGVSSVMSKAALSTKSLAESMQGVQNLLAGEDDEWDSDEDSSPKVLTMESDPNPNLLSMESVAVVHESSSEMVSTTERTKLKNRPEPIFSDDLPSPEPASPEPLKTEVPLAPPPELVPAVTVQVPLPPVRSEQPVLVREPSEQTPVSNWGHRFTKESVRTSQLQKHDSMDVAVEGMVQDAVEKMYNQFHESLSEDPINADMAGRKFSLASGSQLCTPDPTVSAMDSPSLHMDPMNNPFVKSKDAQTGSATEALDALHADKVVQKSHSVPSIKMYPNDLDTPNSLTPCSDLNVTPAASQGLPPSSDEVSMESLGNRTSSLELEDEAVHQVHAEMQKEHVLSHLQQEETQQLPHRNRQGQPELDEAQRRRLLELEEQSQVERLRLEEMQEQQRLKELSWRMSTQAAVTAAVSGGRIEGELRMEVAHLREKLQKMEERAVAAENGRLIAEQQAAMTDKRFKKSEANLKQLYQLLQNERAHRTQLERQLEDHLYQKIQKEEDGNVLFSGCGNLLTRDDQAESDTEASSSGRKDPFLNMFSW